MADSVQQQMEKMIPELEDLQTRGIFHKDEIRKLVQARREFEYQMKRRPLRKIDCLRYISYEMNADTLRKQRKARLGLTKTTCSDFSGVQRIHFIYERALRKFTGDIRLWTQYIDYCKKMSNKILSRVFARALQFHPRNPGLWIEAASWEFSQNSNIDSSRVMMQRAIRVNASSQLLWHEYFRLELLFIQKIRGRRAILGLDKAEKQDIQLDDADRTSGEDTLDDAKQRVLSGAIPKMVYNNAVAAVPHDVDFRLTFLQIASEFPSEFAADTVSESERSIMSNFPKCARALAALASQSGAQALARFEEALTTLRTSEMYEKYVDYILIEVPGKQVLEVLKRAEKDKCTSKKLYMTWMDVLLRYGQVDGAIQVGDRAVEKYPNAEELWLCLFDICERSGRDTNVMKQVMAQLDANFPVVWLRLIHMHMATGDLQRTHAAFQAAIKLGGSLASDLREQYVAWVFCAEGAVAGRKLYQSFFSKQMLPNHSTRRFVETCYQLERSQVEVEVNQTRIVFEKAISLYGQNDAELWIDFIQFYRSQGMHKEANATYWRAVHELEDPVSFNEKFACL